MNLPLIATNTAAVLAGIAGIKKVYAYPPDTIATTPAMVLHMPKGTTTVNGNREIKSIAQRVTLYVARVADGARDAAVVLPYVDLIYAAFTTLNASTLSGACRDVLVTDFDTDVFVQVGGEVYACIDLTLTILVSDVRNYT